MYKRQVWCDWGSALELGAETCADEYSDILFADCDVIHATHVCMRTHNSDRAHVHDMLLFEMCIRDRGYPLPKTLPAAPCSRPRTKPAIARP